MAYGKIKVDTLVYDDNGSDVEFAVSSLGATDLSAYAQLAGATFTGGLVGTTATFTGNVGGANGTFSGNVSGANGTFSGNISGAEGTFTGNVNFDGQVIVKGDSTNGSGALTLNCENNSHGIKLKGPPHSAGASYTLTLPNDTGTSGQFLYTDGYGGLAWGTVSNTSPTFTGIPTAPTAASGTNTTQVATTAFVVAELLANSSSWLSVSTATNAAAAGRYLADTSTAAFTLTLPASPSAGDTIQLADAKGAFATNNLTLGRNGSNIVGQAADLLANVANAVVTLIYSGDTTVGWLVK